MAKESDGQTLRDYKNRKKRIRRIRRAIICMLLLVVAVAGLIHWIRINNMKYRSYEVSKQIKNDGSENAQYIDYGSSVIKYNKDGAQAIDKSGRIIWNGSYNMMDPIADTCGDYAVIADRGNKLVYIYNKKGEVGSIKTLHGIVKTEIAKQGVIAVQMEDEDTNYVKLFYADGSEVTSGEDSTILAELEKGMDQFGYLMDMALSEDGKKLAAIFLSMNSGKLVTNIGFYNYGEVGQNWTDRFAGGYQYEGIIVPKVTFLNNNVACVFKENGMVLYSFTELSNVISEVNFDGKIKSVLHNDKYAGVVLESEEDTAGQLLLYDLKGKKVLDKKLKFDYDKIYLAGDEIIMHDNLTCVVLKSSGTEKFRYTFPSNIAAFYPANSINKYFLASSTDISEITLKE